MKEVDGVLKEWGDRVGYGKVKPRQGRTITGGRYSRPAPTPKRSNKTRLLLTVQKAPEVMVKISGGAKDMGRLKAHLDYISRNGKVEVEDEQGRVHRGRDQMAELRDDWRGSGIPYQNGTRKETFHIILSMPPGTSRPAVKEAARAFAAEQFGNHQYLFAAHEDEKHPHVHLVVKGMDFDGVRLNPRKADLQFWREGFAEELREQGLDANATPRQARGITRKAEKQVVRNIEERGEIPRVKKGQREDAEHEVNYGQVRIQPIVEKVRSQRKQIHHAYGQVARSLAAAGQDEQALAVQLVGFVKQMPPPETRHELMVKELRERSESGSIKVEQSDRATSLSVLKSPERDLERE